MYYNTTSCNFYYIIKVINIISNIVIYKCYKLSIHLLGQYLLYSFNRFLSIDSIKHVRININNLLIT